MAFDPTKLGRISSGANSGVPTVWGYNAGADVAADVAADNYFAGAVHIKVGDHIHVTTDSNSKGAVYLLTSLSDTASTVKKVALA